MKSSYRRSSKRSKRKYSSSYKWFANDVGKGGRVYKRNPVDASIANTTGVLENAIVNYLRVAPNFKCFVNYVDLRMFLKIINADKNHYINYALIYYRNGLPASGRYIPGPAKPEEVWTHLLRRLLDLGMNYAGHVSNDCVDKIRVVKKGLIHIPSGETRISFNKFIRIPNLNCDIFEGNGLILVFWSMDVEQLFTAVGNCVTSYWV